MYFSFLTCESSFAVKLALQSGQWSWAWVGLIFLELLFLVPCWSTSATLLRFRVTFTLNISNISISILPWRSIAVEPNGFISFVSGIFPLLQVWLDALILYDWIAVKNGGTFFPCLFNMPRRDKKIQKSECCIMLLNETMGLS